MELTLGSKLWKTPNKMHVMEVSWVRIRSSQFFTWITQTIVCNPQVMKERQKRGGGESQTVNKFLN